MTLDDFPTLRHVLSFLSAGGLKKNSISSQNDLVEPARAGADALAGPKTWRNDVAASTLESSAIAAAVEESPIVGQKLQVIRLSGTPYQMGFEHGRQKRDAIRRILRRLADLADFDFTELPVAGTPDEGAERFFSADELDELQGMADSVQVPLSNLLALNRTIDADLGSGSLHLVATAASNSENGLIHATSSELPLLSALGDFLEPMIAVRSPEHGHPHVVVSFAGIVGGLNGINSHGLGVTTSMLVNGGTSSRHDRVHAMISQEVLSEAHDIESALDVLRRHSSGQTWNASLSHGRTDRLAYVECDGNSLHMRNGQDTIIAANCALLHGVGERSDKSRRDWNELKTLLTSRGASPITAAQIGSLLSRRSANTNGDGEHQASDSATAANKSVTVVIDARCGDIWINPAESAHGKLPDSCRFSLSELLPRAVEPFARLAASSISSALDNLEDRPNEATHRFVLRAKAAPLNENVPDMPEWHGAALIVGNNPSAHALRARLQAAGVVVRELPITDDLDETLAAFERLWHEQPLPHLFIMTGRDQGLGDPSDTAAWSRRRYRAAVLPFFLCQSWARLAGEHKLLDRCTLIAATALNGDFGISGKVAAPEGAALAGLMKAIYIEFVYIRKLKNMIVKAIDAPDEEPPATLAANICRELASKAIDFEVAYTGSDRWLQYAYPQKAPVQADAGIRRGATWVLTGGARGITAACALELGRRFGLNLHLIGTSPLPQIDPAWRNLSDDELSSLRTTIMREARAAGQSMDGAWSRVQRDMEIDRSLRTFSEAQINATYHSCDVTDADALAHVLQTIRQKDGAIEGVIHGAGVEHSCKFERKKRELVMATIASKVDGAMNLMRLTRQDPVRHFIGFGSVSGRLGSNGQTDYCLANDLLCKLIAWHRGKRPGIRAVTFDWHPWGGVGMAARPEATGALRMTDGPGQMPQEEGVRHLIRELHAGVPKSEVLITDWDFHGRYYGNEDHPTATAQVEARQEFTADTGPASSSTSAAPSPDLTLGAIASAVDCISAHVESGRCSFASRRASGPAIRRTGMHPGQ